MKKQFLLLVMLALMLCLVTACTQTAAPAEAPAAPTAAAAAAADAPAATEAPAPAQVAYKEEIIIAPASGFSTQDVQNCGGTTGMSVYYSVFNTLVDLDVATGELVPDLALSWTAISDTVWEFKLRDDVNFHDGTHFTAEDVKFTIERGLTQSKTKLTYSGTKSVTVVDEYTVQVETEAPNHDFVNKLADTRGSMLSKHAFETLTPEEANKIGTGAYKYVEWVEGDHVTLTRNDEYWGELPKTKTIVVKTMTEATTRLVALQAGDVDLIADPTASDLHFFNEDKNIKLLQYTGSQLRFIGLNISSKPLDNILVRQAIACGINKADYMVATYENMAVPHYSFQHPNTPYYVDGLLGMDYDPQKAKDLLAEAGYPNGLTLELIGPQDDRSISNNAIFQAQMAEIGITLDVQNLEAATFIALTEAHDYAIDMDYTARFFTGLDPLYRVFFYAAPGAVNYFGFNDARINELIDKGLAEFDEAEREVIYKDLQNIIANEMYCVFPICIEPRLYGANAKLDGLPAVGTSANYTYVHVVLD